MPGEIKNRSQKKGAAFWIFFRKVFLKLFVSFSVFIFGLTLVSPLLINIMANPYIYPPDEAPDKRVAIVFGAAIWSTTTPSHMLADRIKTASNLYHQDKIKKILLSGDNSMMEYNEPQTMKNYALSLGISPEDIQLDYAGFRTYDTCERARHVFDLDEAILVTQKAHLQRALFVCQRTGIKSFGVASNLRDYRDQNRQNSREILAKMYAFWESLIFRHKPKFLGEVIEI